MKKQYDIPEVIVCYTDDTDIIATSTSSMSYQGSNKGENGPTAAEGNSRGNAIWDD